MPLSSFNPIKLMVAFRIYFIRMNSLRGGFFFLLLFLLGSCTDKETLNEDQSHYFDSILHKADSLYVPLLEEDAVNFIDSAYNSFPNPGVIDLYNKYDFKRNYFYTYKKDYNKALLYTDSMLDLLREKELNTDFIEYYGKALFSKGNILFTMREYDGAFKCYYEGRKVIEVIQDTCLLSEYSNSLGLVAYTQGKYAEAAAYFKQCFNEYAYCGPQNSFKKYANQQGQLDNIGLCYDKLGKTDSALHYYSSALAYILKDEDKYSYKKDYIEMAKGIIYGNIGTVCYRMGDLEKAHDFFKQSIQINLKKGYANEDAMITRNKLATLYLDQDRLPEAKAELDLVKSALDSIPSLFVELRWNKLQSDYYSKHKDHDQAYLYLSNYVIYT
jgi:tetratricopeptide (TPR) repeat protein